MRRTKSFDQELSEKLRRPRFAQAFINSLMEGEDGLSPEEALRRTIEIMGVKEFAELADVPTSRVHEFLRKRRNFKPGTLNALLRPLRLRAKIVFERAS
ncbi:MAG: hypothetical protein HYY16_05700 [Planctomycetes bacterium]|nr:hypothetical protein [Planctomycetota bacterium]